MIDAFLLIGLPYLAICTFFAASYYRWKNRSYTMSSLSSQFLENRQLLWGSAPWHIGIIGVLLGHGIAFFIPQVWSSLMSQPRILLAVEATGIGLSIISLAGLGVLIFRRLTSARVQAVTSTMDILIVTLLFAQVVLGLLTALQYRWGAAWSTGTASPYLWSLFTLQPDIRFVADFPAVIKLHIILAWILVLLLPFTRLIHVLAVPFEYLFRAPQIVIWNTRRRQEHAIKAEIQAESRREFLKGAAGVAVAGGLLSVGAMDKLVSFFKGPRHAEEAESEILSKKLRRLQQTAEERSLELERKKNTQIQVAHYSELSANKGKYFIDYEMNPGLVFKGENGLPILISAKCTHLGCTVGSELDAQGRILCPCHVSFFDVKTGKPNDGAPAKLPLKHIGWTIMNSSGKTIASQKPGQAPTGSPTMEELAGTIIFIVKPNEEPV